MQSNTSDVINSYIEEVKRKYYSGIAVEYAYRPALQNLIEGLLPSVNAINDAKRTEVGAPDFVLTEQKQNPYQQELFRSVPLGFVEAKDLKSGILDKPENQDQIKRYMDLGNVVHTDGLIFRFYFNRDLVKEVVIGELTDSGQIIADSRYWDDLVWGFKQTIQQSTQTIRTAKMLALHMADRARPIRSTIHKALLQDIQSQTETELLLQYDAFQKTLIHDLTVEDFADIYAETIAYGLFAARYNDDTKEDFSLQEAAQKVPQTNPFLRQFFLQIAAYEKDSRLDWVLNNFAELFIHTDVHSIMSSYGKTTGMNHDPVTHFYETFLGEYDPKRRKARGVYYTPLPVVQYIVRSVNEVLRSEFGLAGGLADDTTIPWNFKTQPHVKTKYGKKLEDKITLDIPKIQILDPATGTSTFLNETVKLIYEEKGKKLGPTGWNDYVNKNLLPRIHGFEILMAAYSMAHMRIGLTLAETGYKPTAKSPRLGIYLTNALEEPTEHDNSLLGLLGMGRTLTEEAIAADEVKRDLPIMVVMGNPPYSVKSYNNEGKATSITNVYKKDLTTTTNKQPLSDDYIKFIRYAESLIEKMGYGVVAYITNNSYLSGIVHDRMRYSLRSNFSSIYILNLHGNIEDGEKTPDGDIDENVFDIKRGVSIALFIKSGVRDKQTKIFYADSYGKRDSKYNFLENNSLATIAWQTINPDVNTFFVPKNFSGANEYFKFCSIKDLFNISSSGITTSDDSNLVSFKAFENKNYTYYYRPFDKRYINYDTKKVKGNRYDKLVRHLICNDTLMPNLFLTVSKNVTTLNFESVLIADALVDRKYSDYSRGPHIFPLKIYHTDCTYSTNLKLDEVKKLLSYIGSYIYNVEKDTSIKEEYCISAIDILDYIYGVLHSPSYRAKYNEFLKIDFPRIPKPQSSLEFTHYARLGCKLRELHLMEGVLPGEYPLDGEGNGMVEKVLYEPNDTTDSANDTTGNVCINQTQKFINIPRIAWDFYIGGYQPAQKWLKDRKGHELGYKDIEHYQKIIKVLLETDRLMQEIDKRIE